MDPQFFYRYVTSQTASSMDGDTFYSVARLRCDRYCMVKETPKGYWIGSSYGLPGFLDSDKTWVSKTSKKRFAYPTKEEALNNFIKRTEKHMSILEHRLGICRQMLKEAKNEDTSI